VARFRHRPQNCTDSSPCRLRVPYSGTEHRLRDYRPISEHGVIGDLRTVALVGTDGTIDWLCLPHFDSPSVFGAILDADRGGYFRNTPTTRDATPKQLYFPDTNVLITRFLTARRRLPTLTSDANRRTLFNGP